MGSAAEISISIEPCVGSSNTASANSAEAAAVEVPPSLPSETALPPDLAQTPANGADVLPEEPETDNNAALPEVISSNQQEYASGVV